MNDKIFWFYNIILKMKFNKYSIQHSMGNVSDIALSPDNSKLASGGWDGFVILWDT